MSGTVAPLAKLALYNYLVADSVIGTSGTTPVGITWAHPGPTLQQEAVYFGKTRWIDEFSAVLSTELSRDEIFRLEVVFDVQYDGDDAQTVETRMWALEARLETILHDNPNLGVPAVILTGCKPQVTQPALGANGQRASLMIVEVECRARK